jgi:hypothetical protein
MPIANNEADVMPASNGDGSLYFNNTAKQLRAWISGAWRPFLGGGWTQVDGTVYASNCQESAVYYSPSGFPDGPNTDPTTNQVLYSLNSMQFCFSRSDTTEALWYRLQVPVGGSLWSGWAKFQGIVPIFANNPAYASALDLNQVTHDGVFYYQNGGPTHNAPNPTPAVNLSWSIVEVFNVLGKTTGGDGYLIQRLTPSIAAAGQFFIRTYSPVGDGVTMAWSGWNMYTGTAVPTTP